MIYMVTAARNTKTPDGTLTHPLPSFCITAHNEFEAFEKARDLLGPKVSPGNLSVAEIGDYIGYGNTKNRVDLISR